MNKLFLLLSTIIAFLTGIISVSFANTPCPSCIVLYQSDSGTSIFITNKQSLVNNDNSSQQNSQRHKRTKPAKYAKPANHNKQVIKTAPHTKNNYQLQKSNNKTNWYSFNGCDCNFNNKRAVVVYNISKGDSTKAMYCYSDGITNYKLTFSGSITFNDEETDITSISPGGYLKFSKTSFGNTRGVIIESNKNGNLLREYYVGKKIQAWEPNGKEWFTNVLPEIIRNTGLGAKERTIKIYKQQGLNGVINEINNINSNSVKAAYYKALFLDVKIPQQEIKTALEKLKNDVNSNYEKSQLLRELSGLFLKDDEVALLYFNTVATITSNYEKSGILQLVCAKHTLNDYQMGALLYATQTLTSNYDKSNTLIEVGKKINFGNALLAKKFFSTTATISSNYDKGNVLNAINRKDNFNTEIWLEYFQTVKTLSSNYEKSNVLVLSAKNLPLNDQVVMNAYIEALETISSSYERSNVLTNLLQKGSAIPKTTLISLIKSTSNISNDFSKHAVLVKVISIRPKNDADVDTEIKTAINTLSSSTYKADLYSKL